MNKDRYLSWARLKFLGQAKEILKSNNGMSGLAHSVEEKLSVDYFKSQFKSMWEDLKTLTVMLKDTAARKYSPKSKKNLLLIVMGLLYFLNPVDVIPDVLIGGFIDDAAVLSWVISKTKEEIENYKQWKSSNSEE